MPFERAVGRMIISQLVPQGLGSNAIIKALRQAGASYRRSDMLKDIRTATGKFKHQDDVINTDGLRQISRFNMVDTDLKSPVKFRVYGEAKIYNTETGEVTTEARSFYTDQYLTKVEWEDEFLDSFRGRYLDAGQSLQDFNITAVEHNKGYSY